MYIQAYTAAGGEGGRCTHVVDGSEAPVAYLSLVDKDGLWVVLEEVPRQLRVLPDGDLGRFPTDRHGCDWASRSVSPALGT